MARNRSYQTTTLFLFLFFLVSFGVFVPVFAPLPSSSSSSSSSSSFPFRHSDHSYRHRKVFKKPNARSFEIADDMFWKDGKPFRIIGGDLHYFRILPQYWEDRLLRAKALGLNTIQTYVPWNLHEPQPGKLVFEGIADLVSFIELCNKLDFLVLLRAGPYICAEWDFGGFPAWLLAIEPALKLRSSDPAYLQLVDRWWGILLPKVAPLLYENGGPIVMVQIENEFGSYGHEHDEAYLHHLVKLAREHLGKNIILYTTDGGSRELLEKGTIRGDAVFSAVDFSTAEDPEPIFKLQKEFNAPGKSPPLSAEFYTGWLTHWGEANQQTDADLTASSLEKIFAQNGSVVLYMAHGGTNFGFYNGANADPDGSGYKPDITSYDYDAPIKESGDVGNEKFRALQRVIRHHSATSLPLVPPDNEKIGYGPIQLQKTAYFFDLLNLTNPADVIESRNPVSMESVGQMFGFLVYVSEYTSKDDGSILSIPEVHDRAQVFLLCTSDDEGRRPTYVGAIERWSNNKLFLPNPKCSSNISLFVLVENTGRVNYGLSTFDRKGILSSVYLDGRILHGWKMILIPLHNLNEVPKVNLISQVARSGLVASSALGKLKDDSESGFTGPSFYAAHFKANEVKDTFLTFRGWGKGIAYVNDFNIGRYWPSYGPQCTLYVPAPILQHGENALVILELESHQPELVIHSVDQPDFTCSSSELNVNQL